MAWIAKVRTMHRNKRMNGFAGIILGAALVVWARLSPDQAPGWALMTGFGGLGPGFRNGLDLRGAGSTRRDQSSASNGAWDA